MTQRTISQGLATTMLVTLGAITMLGPFSTDAFLPALPTMSEELSHGEAPAQLALSGVTIGMALGQLVSGPLSDGIGRRIPLLFGTAGVAIAAIAASFSPNLWVLVTWCVIMGLAASFGAVVSRAVVSDVAEGRQLVSAYSLLGTLTGIGPVVGPLAGVAIMSLWGWRAIFVALGVLAALCCIAIIATVPESLHPEHRQAHPLRSVPKNMRSALRSRAYIGAALVIWCSFAVMFAYIAGSAFLVQSLLGLSKLTYSIAFGVNGCGLIIAGIVTAKISHRLNAHAIVGIGLTMQAVAAVTIAVTAFTGTMSPWTLMPAMFLIAGSMGFIFGPGTTMALNGLRHIAGTALALLGAVQFLFAGIVSPLVEINGPHDPVPFALVVGIGTALAWLAWWMFRQPLRAAGEVVHDAGEAKTADETAVEVG